MKSFLITVNTRFIIFLLALTTSTGGLWAQATSADDDAIRKALDEAYARLAGTNKTAQPSKAVTETPAGEPVLTEAVEVVEPPAPESFPESNPLVQTPKTNPALTVPPTKVQVPPATGQTRPVRPPGLSPNGVTGPGGVRPPPGVTPPGIRPPGAGAVNPALPVNPVAGVPGAGQAQSGMQGTNIVMGSDDDVFPPGLIKFNETDLAMVLDIYQDLTGRTVLKPASLPAVLITIKTQTELTRKEAVQALDSILSLNGITMVLQGDKFVKAVPEATAGAQAPKFNTEPYDDLPDSGTFTVQIVKLKNTVPRDVAQALTPFAKNPQGIIALDDSGVLILRDNAENVKRMMEVLEQIDVVPIREIEPVVIPIKYALASDIAQVLSTLTEGGSTTTVGSQGGSGLGGGAGGGGIGARGTGSFGGQSSSYGRGGSSAYGGGRGGGYASPYSSFTRNTTAAAGAAGGSSSFQNRLRNIVNQASGGSGEDIKILGQTQIIADERTNSLLIFAAKADIPTILDIVEKLDVVLPQVLLESIIMEVALNDDWSMGVSWIQRPQSIGNFTGAGTSINRATPADPGGLADPFAATNLLQFVPGLNYFGKVNNDFDIAVSAAASDSRINVLSRPRVQTSHAVEANLFIGETRPVITGTYFGGSGFGSTSQYQQLQIGITLSVLPLINSEGLVVMDIRQRIQNIGGNVVIDGNDVPITNDREANAKVAVRDRETVMLGGFISSDDNKSESGIPFLKDIPLLGALFRSKSKATTRREMIILIRPTVLPTPLDASEIVQAERNRMPGIIAAERDFNKEEQELLNRESKELLKREGFKVR